MQFTRRTILLGLTASGLCLPQAAAAETQVASGPAFGTSWHLVTDRQADIAAITRVVDTIVNDVDKAASPYRADSDITRFNQALDAEPQEVSGTLCQIASSALGIAALTDGAFDPTVGPLVARYGFGPIQGERGSYADISSDETTLQKAAPRLTLDLCGIAKGYALDRIIDGLVDMGVENALVEIGGEVRAIGHHPKGRPWNVAIADPSVRDFRPHTILRPGHLAVATSGHAANGLRGQISVSHIIDADSGKPASTALASVTVLASTAMHADALATALCANGAKAGIALARKLAVPALFLTDGVDTPPEIMTGTFSHYVSV
jgi:thiamine biosynthesis lipoprotein